jgi:hypothetical protein
MRIRAAFTALLWSLLAVSTAGAATLEGRWILVEETYGAGGADLTRHKPPLTIEFAREGGSLAGTIRESPAVAAQRWPIAGPAGAPIAAGDLEVALGPGEDRVRARYLTPENDDRFRLHVVEEYRVSEDGAYLIGTMTVTFLREGEPRGSFVLHRRFERR